MLAVVSEQSVDFSALNAGAIETSTGKKIREASATRWVIQFFKDIPLFDNLGPAVMNNLTLRDGNPETVLKRCQPYPLTNCEYEVSLHEAKRYGNFGEELAENDLAGNYAGRDPKSEGAPRHIVEPKFAYSCARELSEMYAATHGLVVLEPLTGVEDYSLVKQVFDLVQPVTWRLHVLEGELREGAVKRIEKSKASEKVKAIAEGCRKLMLKGCLKAIASASEHMSDFTRQVQLASAGHKGNRAFPVAYDEFVGEQLGVEVPRVVRVEKKSDTNEELLAMLAERELAKGNENETLNRALALLEEEREARKALEAKVEALAAKGA